MCWVDNGICLVPARDLCVSWASTTLRSAPTAHASEAPSPHPSPSKELKFACTIPGRNANPREALPGSQLPSPLGYSPNPLCSSRHQGPGLWSWGAGLVPVLGWGLSRAVQRGRVPSLTCWHCCVPPVRRERSFGAPLWAPPFGAPRLEPPFAEGWLLLQMFQAVCA